MESPIWSSATTATAGRERAAGQRQRHLPDAADLRHRDLSAYSVAVADVNGDGKPDIVVANQLRTSVSVLLNNGNGNFTGQVYTIEQTPTVAITAEPPAYSNTSSPTFSFTYVESDRRLAGRSQESYRNTSWITAAG